MIRLREGNRAFNYRIVGVAIHDGRVLLHRGEEEAFWTLPGGRAELGEPATETLKREMREELQEHVEVARLLWVVENFFSYMGANWHELALYFLMSFPPESPVLQHREPFQGIEEFYEVQPDGMVLIFEWFPLEQLDGLILYPAFLKQSLRVLPTETRHIVYQDVAI